MSAAEFDAIEPLDSYFADLDGEGEPTLWYSTHPGAKPIAVVRRCDLRGDREFHWGLLVRAMEAV